MNLMEFLQAFILGLVEGLTEFIPVSSTGHQIIVADLIHFEGARAQAFNIVIQLGAILALMWEYRQKIFSIVANLPHSKSAQHFTSNLVVAVIPAVVLGVSFADAIHTYLFNPITVASALVIGGGLMLWAEQRTHQINTESVDALSWKQALKIGLFQCLALIPGTSRSASSIIGGLLCGLSRRTATEFSFFLAMPTMVGAAGYSFYKYQEQIQSADWDLFCVGLLSAFVFALIAVKSLLQFIGKHSYAVFAWYRIGFGLLILTTWQLGMVDWQSLH